MNEILKKYYEWRKDYDYNRVYDEIGEFFNTLRCGELLDIIEMLKGAKQ